MRRVAKPLPGGLSRRRALVLLFQAGPAMVVPPWFFLPFVLAGGAFAHDLAPIAVVVSCSLLGLAWSTRRRTALVMDPRVQPELAALVAGVAAESSCPAPRAVRLVAEPNATLVIVPGRRPVLELGYPLLRGLTEPELRMVVAHELAHSATRSSYLARRLVEAWAVQVAAFENVRRSRRRQRRRLEKWLAAVRPAVESAERAADAAAVALGGPELAARALVRLHVLSESLDRFCASYAGPLARAGQYPVDLYEVWEAKLTAPRFAAEVAPRLLGELLAEQRSDPADEHPGLRDRVAATGHADLAGLVTPSGPPLHLRPLEPAALDRLTRALLGAGRFRRPRPVHLSDPQVLATYEADNTTIAELLQTAVGELLGVRQPTGEQVFQTVTGPRFADLAPLLDPEEPDQVDRVAVLGSFLLRRLQQAGYRSTSTIDRFVLLGPGGDRVDVAEIARAAAAGQPDTAARARAAALAGLAHPAPTQPEPTQPAAQPEPAATSDGAREARPAGGDPGRRLMPGCDSTALLVSRRVPDSLFVRTLASRHGRGLPLHRAGCPDRGAETRSDPPTDPPVRA